MRIGKRNGHQYLEFARKQMVTNLGAKCNKYIGSRSRQKKILYYSCLSVSQLTATHWTRKNLHYSRCACPVQEANHLSYTLSYCISFDWLPDGGPGRSVIRRG